MAYLMLSAIFYAVNNFFWKRMLFKISPLSLIWCRGVFTVIFSSALLYLLGISFQEVRSALSQDGWLYMLAASCGSLGLFLMVTGLNESSLSHFAFFLVLMSVMSLFGVSLVNDISITYLLGSISLIVAFIIHSVADVRKFSIQKSSWRFLLMSLAFTCSGFINWHLVKNYNPFISVWTQEIFLFLLLTIVGLVKGKAHQKTLKTYWKSLGVFASLILAATYFGANGLRLTDPLLLCLIGLVSPLFTSILGSVVLKEKWSSKYYYSFGLLAIGIALFLMD